MNTDLKTQEAARAVLETVPHTMRIIGGEMRRLSQGLFPGHMRILGMCTDQAWTLSELAEAQGVSSPTMSRTVNALVERGWLTRTPSERDRREVRIGLTSHGQEVFEESYRKVQTNIAALLAHLSPEELETMVSGVAILRDAFQNGIDAEMG